MTGPDPARAEPGHVEPGHVEPGHVEPEWKRRRRLAEVFGDVLPETTSDEREDGGERGSRTSDEWLKAQVPPHHGG